MRSREQNKGDLAARALLLLAMGIAVVLLCCVPITALELVAPANGTVVLAPLVLVQYATSSSSCEATFNDATFPLVGCGNFTMTARPGENTISIWDGIERVTARFTYSPGAVGASGPAAASIPPPGQSIATAGPGIAPGGLVVRGRTRYAIPTARVTGTDGSAVEVADLRGRVGPQRIELQPLGSRIRMIRFEGVAMPQEVDLGLEELAADLLPTGETTIDAFAIDPTRISFTNGTITKTAVGNRVWKCAAWDFENRSCGGDWELVATPVPGASYDILFNATDPAYVETFDLEAAGDVRIAALDNVTFVLAFIDSGTNHSSFEIWNTNGVRVVDEVDVDIDGNLESRIDIDVINRTHFVIALIDGPEDDLDIFIYDRNGNQVLGRTQVDSSVGLNTDVAACQLGDRFGLVDSNDNDDDADYRVYNNAGANLTIELAIDTTITPGTVGQNLVACSALNSTHWGYAFYDDADNDATLGIISATGAVQVVATDIDNNVGETGQVATTGLRGNRMAMAFYDSTDDDVTLTIRSFAAGALSTILAATDIDTNAGADSRVAAAEIENSGTSEFVVAWQDTNDTTIKAAIYNATGSQMTAPFNITTTPSTTNPLLDVAGYNNLLGVGLCNGTFAITYTNASGNTVFETYWRNGTRWDGICGAPDTIAPNITLLLPPDETVNDTSNTIDFIFNVSDESDVLNCTLLIDGVNHTSQANPPRDTTLNITIQLDNGEHNWSIWCIDVAGNIGEPTVRNLTVDVPLSITGAETRMAALDNTTLIIAFIDGSQNDASFEIWHTNGTRLVNVVDVDTSVDAASRIAVDVVNSTHFIIGVLDGPEDDFDFYLYDLYGDSVIGVTQIDPGAGDNTDIDICQLGDRFAAPWADTLDGDANYEVWGNNGVAIAAENQVDTSIGPGATLQNLVACAALNSTHWGYAFYDDADNDATLAIVNNAGAVQVVATDIDNNVGETGQVATTGLRGNRMAMAFYDSTDDDVTLTIRSFAAGALSTILAATDIDTNAGADSRVAAAEIENSGTSEFVVAWQDTNDTTIKAAIYNATGSQMTAPFNITNAPNATNLLIDVAGYNSLLGVGLCNGTFAVAYANASGNTVFETYWRNGTRWDGKCGEPPDVTAVDLPPSIVLNAGTTKLLECNLTVNDPDGFANLIGANATLYHISGSIGAADNPSSHYSNTSCTSTGSSTLQQNYTCGFQIWHFALNGTWYCQGTARDVYKNQDTMTSNTTIDPLYALNITETFLDFGNLETGSTSVNISQNVSNVGNMRINVSVLGYGTMPGDGYGFSCANGNLSANVVHFASNITASYTTKEALNGTYKPLRMALQRSTMVGNTSQNTSYWQVMIPANTSATGQCNGTIVFQADAS